MLNPEGVGVDRVIPAYLPKRVVIDNHMDAFSQDSYLENTWATPGRLRLRFVYSR
jgi:hypothetical protein